MKQIYKREPVQRSLPSNFSELDAVNYTNLNNFKGLQVYDNPLVADPASTYSAKNVYVDEHSNLTVRPALRYIETADRWQYEASNGVVLTVIKSGDDYIMSARYNHNGSEIIVNDYSIANPNIVPVVENNQLYLLVQLPTTNQLTFLTLKPGSKQFAVDSGVMFLDDPNRSDISHYNILNKYTQTQIVRQESEFELFRPEALYTSGSTTYISDGIYLSDAYTLSLSQNSATVYYRNGDTVIPAYIYFSEYLPNSDSVISSYGMNESQALTKVRLSNNIIRGSQLAYSLSPVGSDSDAYTYANDASVSARVFTLDITGDIIEEEVFTKYAVDIVDSGNVLIGADVIRTGDSWLFVSVELKPNGETSTPILKIRNSKFELTTTKTLEAIQTGAHYAQDGTRTAYLCNGHKPVAVFSASEYSFAVGIMWKRFSQSSSQISVTNACRLFAFELKSSYSAITYSDAWNSYLTVFFSIAVFNGDMYHGFIADGSAADSKCRVNLRIYRTTMTSGGTPTTAAVLYEPPELLRAYSEDTVLVAAATNEGLSIGSYQDGKATSWVITPTSIYTYTLSGYLGPAIVYNDGKLLLSPSHLVTRGRATEIVNTTRSTANIPVISDIKDNFVTYFFLDNIHWFIFEHTILASGVDNVGFHTIRRLDPLKYFKFTEKLTGAIRASDSSFWVFHSNGSYLIYKSSITLAEQTNYYWLCTNAAKSKGCDFTNAIVTLPVSNNIAVVTSDDISTVVLRENVATDERILVPLTLSLAADTRQLLQNTESIVVGQYKYLTLFFLNQDKDTVPTLVFDNVGEHWWYWEFPVSRVYSCEQIDHRLKVFTEIADINKCAVYDLTDDEYTRQVGSIEYSIYADRLDNTQAPTQIDWKWQSAVQMFGTVERRKQLLFTTFVFDDYMPDEDSEQVVEFGFYFDVYARAYATSRPDSTTAPVYRVSNNANKTMIASFNYLQLVLHHSEFDESNYEALTKPKICSISLKYRLLRGEWT